ncbi:hypothetical protein LTS18_014036 [Coniosporium uncinatum]|uniref:Uncharacterized protein n=1 Tax=Coniosporium uncinatum TaxID=93489 RepID=A0ACC3DV52_9PEZI|nr:hypothetical protein LTS18_014036 [Coniosporium uncinatum]
MGQNQSLVPLEENVIEDDYVFLSTDSIEAETGEVTKTTRIEVSNYTDLSDQAVENIDRDAPEVDWALVLHYSDASSSAPPSRSRLTHDALDTLVERYSRNVRRSHNIDSSKRPVTSQCGHKPLQKSIRPQFGSQDSLPDYVDDDALANNSARDPGPVSGGGRRSPKRSADSDSDPCVSSRASSKWPKKERLGKGWRSDPTVPNVFKLAEFAVPAETLRMWHLEEVLFGGRLAILRNGLGDRRLLQDTEWDTKASTEAHSSFT